MQRFTVVQLSGGPYAVKVGKSHRGKFRYVQGTESRDRVWVQRQADYRQAREHIDQALTLLKGLEIDQAKKVAQHAEQILLDYEERAREEDPEFDPSDPKAYLC